MKIITIYYSNTAPIRENIINPHKFTTTIVGPTGVSARSDIKSPITAHTMLKIAALITTALKFLKILIADNAGNIIRADTRSEPTRFMARTIITAITTAMEMLYTPAFIPVAFEKFSSNVIANILL